MARLRSEAVAESVRGAEATLREILRPAWAIVDLDSLEHNLSHLRRTVAPARILAVIKADAYGHGAPAVARTLEAAAVERLGVALVEEGAELRRAGVRTPILVLGPAQPAQLPLYRSYRLTPTVSSRQQLALWSGWAAAEGGPQAIHVKVDTGMARLGLAPEELPGALEEIRRHPALELQGFLSHFAEAEELASPRNAEQEARFADLLGLLTPAERERVEVHLANSAAALHRPASRHTSVRIGLALFGVDPAGREAGLAPVLSVATRIIQLREVPAGTRAGYGGRWQASRRSRLAVVPVGYADGYAWKLSGGAAALVGGRRVPVVGAVSMDMTLLDVTEADAHPGSEVILLGRQGGEEVGARELAERAGTIPYEILCLFGLRLPRRYRRGGRDVAIDSRLAGPLP